MQNGVLEDGSPNSKVDVAVEDEFVICNRPAGVLVPNPNFPLRKYEVPLELSLLEYAEEVLTKVEVLAEVEKMVEAERLSKRQVLKGILKDNLT